MDPDTKPMNDVNNAKNIKKQITIKESK